MQALILFRADEEIQTTDFGSSYKRHLPIRPSIPEDAVDERVCARVGARKEEEALAHAQVHLLERVLGRPVPEGVRYIDVPESGQSWIDTTQYLPEADDVVGRPAGEEHADQREGDADRVELGLAQPPRRRLPQLARLGSLRQGRRPATGILRLGS